jgi:hypothetical protein
MKPNKINPNDFKNNLIGGKVLSTDNQGNIIATNNATNGGYGVGNYHSEGGIQGINNSTNELIEFENNEVVITKKAVLDNTLHEFDGEMLTNKQILSKINVSGGGVKFDTIEVNDAPKGKIHVNPQTHHYDKQELDAYELLEDMGYNSALENNKETFVIHGVKYDIAKAYELIENGAIDFEIKTIAPFYARYIHTDKKQALDKKIDYSKPIALAVQPKNGKAIIIDGNHRLHQAKSNDIKEVQVIYISDSFAIAQFSKIVKKKGGLIAPNGNPSNLTPEQHKLVRTPEFKAWFGDWENDPENASKVVDENGEPMVVYHGTNVKNITIFDPMKGLNINGTYHAKDIKVASHWSGTTNSRDVTEEDILKIKSFENLEEILNYAGDILRTEYIVNELYTSPKEAKMFGVDSGYSYRIISTDISTPLNSLKGKQKASEIDKTQVVKNEIIKDLEFKKAYDSNSYGKIYINFLNIKNPLVVDAKGKSYYKIQYKGLTFNTEAIALDAIKNNYDGVIVENVLETDYENIKTTDYITFSPTQIKLADGTNTKFDATNPDIRYAKGGLTNKNGHLAENMSLSDIATMHDTSIEKLEKQVKKGLKVEREHTSNPEEQLKIVKDHLYENHKYYSILEKVGLENGGEVYTDNEKKAKDLIEVTTEKLVEEIIKNDYFVDVNRSKTDFGKSNYIYVSDEVDEYGFLNGGKKKIRISDHGVTNIDRIFNETHLHPYEKFYNEKEEFKDIINELNFYFKTNKFFDKEIGFTEVKAYNVQTYELWHNDVVTQEKITKKGKKMFEVTRTYNNPVEIYKHKGTQKIYKKNPLKFENGGLLEPDTTDTTNYTDVANLGMEITGGEAVTLFEQGGYLSQPTLDLFGTDPTLFDGGGEVRKNKTFDEKTDYIIGILKSKYEKGETLESLYNQVKEGYGDYAGAIFSTFAKEMKSNNKFMEEFNKSAFIEDITQKQPTPNVEPTTNTQDTPVATYEEELMRLGAKYNIPAKLMDIKGSELVSDKEFDRLLLLKHKNSKKEDETIVSTEDEPKINIEEVISKFTFMADSPMRRARALSVLEQKTNFDGKIIFNYEFLEGLPKDLEIETRQQYSKKTDKTSDYTFIGNYIIKTKAEIDYYKYLQNGGYPYSDYLKAVATAEKIKNAEKKIKNEEAELQQSKKDKIAKYEMIKDFLINNGNDFYKKYIESFINKITEIESQRKTKDSVESIEHFKKMIDQYTKIMNDNKEIYPLLYKIVHGEVQHKFNWKVGDKVKVKGSVNHISSNIETEIIEIKENRFGDLTYKVESNEGIINQWRGYDGLFPINDQPTPTEFQKLSEVKPTIKTEIKIVKKGNDAFDKQAEKYIKLYLTLINNKDNLKKFHNFIFKNFAPNSRSNNYDVFTIIEINIFELHHYTSVKEAYQGALNLDLETFHIVRETRENGTMTYDYAVGNLYGDATYNELHDQNGNLKQSVQDTQIKQIENDFKINNSKKQEPMNSNQEPMENIFTDIKVNKGVVLEKDKKALIELINTQEQMNPLTNSKNFSDEGSSTGTGALYEFFTPELVANKMLALAQKYGFRGGKVLEPAAGNGRLLKHLETQEITAFEINESNFVNLKINFPEAELYNHEFEKAFLQAPRYNQLIKNNKSSLVADYDLVISNPPYGIFKSRYSSYFKGFNQFEHFFIEKSLSLLKKGGIGVYLIPSGFMRNAHKYNEVKKRIFQLATFVDAYRLPQNIFEKTSIGTDILILKRK